MAERYCDKDGGYAMQLGILAVREGPGIVGVYLYGMGGRAGRADISGCTAAQEETTGLYEFLF